MNIRKLFIANRAEIASRIIRTCERLGVQTVAAASLEDLSLPYLRQATEYEVIPAHSANGSFLDADLMIDLARRYNCDAIHPGFGFLSESADFADKVVSAGLIFIGPHSAAMRTLGSKTEAKALAAQQDVPVLPQLLIEAVDSQEACEAAKAFFKEQKGLVLIKAAGGGGGRGMRIVSSESELAHLMEAASREAEKFFSDKRIFLERLITDARHIEVQIFGDMHQNVTHLFERDCSLQRRHQKIIEEAPAPGLSAELRAALHQYSLRLASALEYDNAGTVEFLVTSAGETFFLEVNSRLQVEHPVTEELLGVDLVEWQLLTASGENMAQRFAALPDTLPEKHVIEVRVCAEDPLKGFLPSSGVLEYCDVPSLARNDFGYEAGSWVGSEFDSMIGKIIVAAESREEAQFSLLQALEETFITGLPTNISFLNFLLGEEWFSPLKFSTSTIDDQVLERFLAQQRSFSTVFAAAYVVNECGASVLRSAANFTTDHTVLKRSMSFCGVTEALSFSRYGSRLRLSLKDSEMHEVEVFDCEPIRDLHHFLSFRLGDQLVSGLASTSHKEGFSFSTGGHMLEGRFEYPELRSSERESAGASAKARLLAEIPGKVLEVRYSNGDQVEAGDTVIVIESMKMEIPITAPRAGAVTSLSLATGQVIAAGDLVCHIE